MCICVVVWLHNVLHVCLWVCTGELDRIEEILNVKANTSYYGMKQNTATAWLQARSCLLSIHLTKDTLPLSTL